MLKKVFTFVAVALTFVAQAHAFCGGTPDYSNDCSSNNRAFATSCCPSGYRVQGVAYNDMRSSGNNDIVDAVSAVCRSISKGNDMMPSDFQAPPITLMCDKTEVLAGTTTIDFKGNDAMDGMVIWCQKPGSTNLRMVGNNGDTGSNGETHTVLLPKRVVGIGYKDNQGDQADCATISVK